MSTAAVSPPQPIQTLRASCDACASSKVKCDKEQPACRRCSAGGTACVYGVSRKHGKQPRRKLSAAVADGRTPPHDLAPRTVDDVHSLRAAHFSTNVDLGFDDLLHDMGLNTGISAMDGGTDLDQYNLPTPESPIAHDEWSTFADFNPFFHDDRSQSTKRYNHRSFNGNHSSYDSHMAEPPDNVRFFGGSLSRSSSDFSSSQSSHLTPTSRATSVTSGSRWRSAQEDDRSHQRHLLHSPTNVSTHQQQSQLPKAPHSCSSLAASALETLRLEARYGCTKKRALEGPGSTPLPILNLDHILEANKTALSTLQQTLDCKCSERHAPLAFLYASIFSKVIFWYQVGGRMIRSATAAANGPGRYASTSHSALPEDCGQTRGSVVAGSFSARSLESLPISIGDFRVDAEDRATLSQHLLLSELRKAVAVADRLQRRNNERDHESLGPAEGGGTGELTGMLGSWIQAELGRTIREVKSIPDAMPRPPISAHDRYRMSQQYMRK